jgi:hypothetical protein
MGRRSGLFFMFVVAVSACGPSGSAGGQSPSTGLPSAEASQRDVSDAEIADAIQTRKLYGLRIDEEWVRAVAEDPAAQAGITLFGIPLSPSEQADIRARRWDEDLLRQGQAYCRSASEDCAGTYINLKGSGVIVDIAHNVERHRVALRNLVADPKLVEVHEVEWSLAELEGFIRRVEAERAWFETVGVEFMQVDRGVTDNFVHVDYMARTDVASPAIEAHFGNPSWLRAEWAGAPPWSGPRADLAIRIRDEESRPGIGIRCDIQPHDKNVGVDLGNVVFGTDTAGVCKAKNIPTGTYRVRLFRWVQGHEERVSIDDLQVVLPTAGRQIDVRIPSD